MHSAMKYQYRTRLASFMSDLFTKLGLSLIIFSPLCLSAQNKSCKSVKTKKTGLKLPGFNIYQFYIKQLLPLVAHGQLIPL